ncbi:hypothetical protein [Streptomyces sp. NPDC002547]
MTGTLGLLLVVAVTAVNIGDRDAAEGLLRRLRRLHRDITSSGPTAATPAPSSTGAVRNSR